MLKQAAILLAAIALTACAEDTAVSATASETTTSAEKAKEAALIKATKAAIIIESYEVETNKVTPANHSAGAGGAER